MTCCQNTVLVFLLRASDHFILDFNETIFMQQVLPSGIWGMELGPGATGTIPVWSLGDLG